MIVIINREGGERIGRAGSIDIVEKEKEGK